MTSDVRVNVNIQTEDIQAVLQSDRVFALEVQNRALSRMITELQAQLEQVKNEKSSESEDHKEIVSAFLEKRKPVFKRK